MSRERKELGQYADNLYKEVKNILDGFAERHPLTDRTPAEIIEVKRYWANTSIVIALSNTLHTTDEKVIKTLADKTAGLEMETDKELRAALEEGLKLGGERFQNALLQVLQARLSYFE